MQLIRGAGRIPVERDTVYNELRRWEPQCPRRSPPTMTDTDLVDRRQPAGSDADRELVARELRIGRIDFLNMYPMHWALGDRADAHGVPTDVNRAIVEGDVDVACMSSIEYARHADELVLLPSMCVSAEGAVGSIFAISNVPFEQTSPTCG